MAENYFKRELEAVEHACLMLKMRIRELDENELLSDEQRGAYTKLLIDCEYRIKEISAILSGIMQDAGWDVHYNVQPESVDEVRT